MVTSKEVFLRAIGREPTVEDAALVYTYDGQVDKIEFSTIGSLNNINTVLAYAIAEHIKHVNNMLGDDITADVLRTIFEQVKARLRSKAHGNN